MSTDKLTNAYAVHAELIDLQDSAANEKTELKVNHRAQQFFTVATWIIYLLFAASMYAAPLWVLQSFFGANAGNYLAIIVIGVFLLVFPTALALGKHAGYKALSKRGIDPRYIGAIIAFFIASGIYFEATSASSQQQEKAHQAVENSNAGKAIMGTTVSTGTGDYAALTADAEYKLVACQRKLAEGKTKDCKNSQARVASLKEQASADRAAAITANAQAIPLKQAALEKERESHALPIAKMFSGMFGATVATGAVIAALLAALIFEISHSLTIYNEWRLTREIAELDARFKGLKIDYFHQTGKQFDTADFNEDEIINLVEMRQNGKIEHFNDRLQDAVSTPNDGGFQKNGIGFTAPVTSRFAGFVDTNKRKVDAPAVRESSGFRQSPEQLANVHKLAGQAQAEVTAKPQAKPQACGSGEVLGETASKPQACGSEGATGSLYPSWVASVKAGECRPSVNETWHWIQKQIAPKETGSKTNDRTRIGNMQKAFFSRAINEGLMTINPNYTNGGKKYIWIG
jgi:hypothetical protein